MFSNNVFSSPRLLFAFPFRRPPIHRALSLSYSFNTHRNSEWEKKKKILFIIKRWYFWNYFLFKLLCLWEKHTIWNFRAEFFSLIRLVVVCKKRSCYLNFIFTTAAEWSKIFFMCVVLFSSWLRVFCVYRVLLHRCCWRKLKN